jgi:hypothetical protein
MQKNLPKAGGSHCGKTTRTVFSLAKEGGRWCHFRSPARLGVLAAAIGTYTAQGSSRGTTSGAPSFRPAREREQKVGKKGGTGLSARRIL